MGQCKSHNYIVEEDAAASVSPRPVPERVEKKKKGRFFRWAFSRKSKKTSTEAQQSQCRNDSSQQPERCSDGEVEQNSNIDNNSVYSWHTCVSSLTTVQDAEKDIPSQEQRGISSTHNSSPSLTVPSMTEENSSASTSDDVSWKNEDEIINLSSKGKKGDVLQHYQTMKMLGRGSYGNVYEGIRLSDSRKVALKCVLKTECMENVRIDLFGKSLPNEVAMMVLVNKGPSVPQIIKLLDWYETPEEYVLVLERPTPCEDLRCFLLQNGGKMKESTARVVMRQVVTAARICSERGIFHSDIKLENLLINRNTLQVKLIDFGCSRRLTKSPYLKFSGTKVYCPPEFVNHQRYHGKPATVYSLGVLMCKMLSGKYPRNNLPQMFAEPWYIEDISKECRDLISSGMERDPAKRIDLKKILLHDWFQVLVLT
ncbi:serine/threonine-protein kinase pim-2-like [Rhinichthys klamathensis goyatoka]|uniref:serine/threonine-protein kinase pim-2-like n=1 Tax=Rhinichthys klamathensis goyatoka TaxID=3034132 RepID=UPI0024B5DDC3|nr:serine/threonine-protein kinase pim-2-like [Rhinichthys klamathensis goyatoka]